MTRPEHQSGDFNTALESLGASVVVYPTIRICDPESWNDLDRCIGQLERYSGIVFTSANAVERFFRRRTTASLDDTTMYAVGSKTQEALRTYHVTVTIIPDRFTSEDLLAAVVGTGIKGKRLLYPRGSRDRCILAEGLVRAGAVVDECIVYRTELADPASSGSVKRRLDGRSIDIVTFFSPSSVEGFFESLMNVYADRPALQGVLQGVPVAVIGSVTAEAVRRHGIVPAIIPPVSTAAALADAIAGFYSS